MDSNTFLAICMICLTINFVAGEYFNQKRRNKKD